MSILLGINVYAAKGDAARRQENCLKSLRALEGVSLVNLQFADDPIEAERFDTVCELKNDSRKVTGRKGPQKPIVSELFTILAEQARSRGLRYFGFANSDIIISQSAIDCAVAERKEAYVFSRMDYDGESGKDIGMLIFGADLFIIDTRWWLDNKWRFRPYIFGEFCWDNVYASIILCHAQAVLLNREASIKHERHANNLGESPFGWYNGLLAALDTTYLRKRFHPHCIVSDRQRKFPCSAYSRLPASKLLVACCLYSRPCQIGQPRGRRALPVKCTV